MMAEDEPVERRTIREEQGEQRSIDPQTVIDGVTAYGLAAGGTGGLLAGAAKFKEVFFGDGGQEPAPPADSQPQQPKED
jgi:hypothetical protein